MRAMVFAAGFGTRMRPLTQRRAKPALPVLCQPLLRYAIATLARAGIHEIAVNTHHRPDDVRAALDGVADVELNIVHESGEILGTGGGLYNVRDYLAAGGDSFAVLNGDTLIELDLAPVLEAHAERGGLATMVLRNDERAVEFGALGYDGNLRIWDFVGRVPVPDELTLYRALFTGVHVLRKEALDNIPPGYSGLGQSFYPEAIERGEEIRAYLHEGYWADIGTPERYLETHWDLLAGRAPGLALDPFAGRDLALDPTAELDEATGVWLATSSHIDDEAGVAGPVLLCDQARVEAGAEIGPNVVVGAGAVVPAGAKLEHCVVWEKTDVKPGHHAHCIITPEIEHTVPVR